MQDSRPRATTIPVAHQNPRLPERKKLIDGLARLEIDLDWGILPLAGRLGKDRRLLRPL
jgi:hypothetical protein